MRIAVLTVSDAAARGERTDTSGDAIEAWVRAHGYELVERVVVPDDTAPIATVLAEWSDGARAGTGRDAVDLVLTTGGTGLGPRDVTPEATRAVLHRAAPGIAERIRILSIGTVPRAALSRGIAGTRHRTLIINLPGSPGGVSDGLAALEPIIDHAVAVVRADRFEHAPGDAPPSVERPA